MDALPAGEQAQADELERLHHLLYTAPVGLIRCELPGGRVRMMNPLVVRLAAPLVLAWDGGSVFDLLREAMPDLQAQVEAGGAGGGLLFEGRRIALEGAMPGAMTWLSVTAQQVGGDELTLALVDITREVEQEMRLRQANAWIGALVQASGPHMACALDAAGRITRWTAYGEALTGHATAEMLGRPYGALFGLAADAPEAAARLRRARSHGWDLDEGLLYCKAAGPLYASTLVSVLDPGDPQAAFCLVARDMSRQRDAIEALRAGTVRDALTGVYNRAFFFLEAQDRTLRALETGAPLAVLVADVDRFKPVNDTYGHAVGDRMLRHVADLLRRHLRVDAVLARIGGDEFAALLPDCSVEGALVAAERLRRVLAEAAFDFPDGPRQVTLSLGVADVGAAGSLAEALAAADGALYRAKAAGRNAARAAGRP